MNIYGSDLVLENGSVIKDVSFLLTPELVAECSFDINLAHQSVLTEGAKFDLLLKNFLKEGEDYRGLKKDLKEIIAANDMSDEQLRSKGKGFLHVCKRVLQILQDINVPFSIGFNTTSMIAKASVISKLAASLGVTVNVVPIFVGGIVGMIVGIIINRLFRLAIDAVEFDRLKKDAEDIVRELRSMAKKNPKMAKKYNSEADRLEASIKKYSK